MTLDPLNYDTRIKRTQVINAQSCVPLPRCTYQDAFGTLGDFPFWEHPVELKYPPNHSPFPLVLFVGHKCIIYNQLLYSPRTYYT